MKKFFAFLFVILFAVVLVGCKTEKVDNTKVTSITISVDLKNIKVGDVAKFTAKVEPETAKDKTVTWTSSDPEALQIDQNGQAKALKEAGRVYVKATSNADNNIYAQKSVKIASAGGSETGDFPDLQGYTIKIAQAEQALGNYDPHLPSYTQQNKDAMLDAWDYVQDNFNCTIEVVAYPSDAEWGPSRWNYILNQAKDGVADYDFYTVPSSQIPEFVEGNCLIDLTDFYTLYGNNTMDASFKTCATYKSKLYMFLDGANSIYNVMYYNIGLFKKLHEVDDTLKEPAEIYNEGNWTYTQFVNYCKKVQDAMAILYGVGGTANAEGQEYYAVSGWDSYWFVGLAGTDGVPLADVSTSNINFGTDHKMQAAEAVKQIYTSGVADPKQSVDQAVTSWNEGKSFFNTGDLWFVGDADRWKKDLWGAGETEYGYCPWPRPDDLSVDGFKIPLGSGAGWVMPIGRDYNGYGDECTPENIYRAICVLYQVAKQKYEGSPTYDKAVALNTTAEKYAHSAASQQAYKHVVTLIENGRGYYDPLSNNDNPIGSLYTPSAQRLTIKGAVTAYTTTGTVDSWAEAIADVVPILQEALIKAFG